MEHIAGAITGLFHQASWHDGKKAADFYLTKGIVDYLLTSFGLENVSYQATAAHDEMHPGRTADIFVGDEFVGFIGEVHPTILKEYKLKRTYVFELDLAKLISLDKKELVYQPVSKYPTITRDIAMAVAKEVSNAAIVETIKANGGPYLKEVKLFDLYEGEHIDFGFKSLAYTLVFNNPEKTLVEEEVNQAFDKVVTELKAKFNIVVR